MCTVNVPDYISNKLQCSEPMRKHTLIGIGGRAYYYIQANTVEELKTVMHFAESEGLTLFALGAGTNILVSDKGIDGIVVKLSGSEFDTCVPEGNTLTAGAACSLRNVVRTAVASGMGGVECMAGIPGSVGGALMMNAGGRYGTIADQLEQVTVLDSSLNIKEYHIQEMRFGYRSSPFEPGEIILSARFRCFSAPVDELADKRNTIYSEKSEKQPLGERSCGCVFKNPEDRSAGELIESLGFKGEREGDIEVSSVHANYLINRGRGSSRDMMSLMNRICGRAMDTFGIALEPEIVLWGECGWRQA